jgi:uncharacterized membrane protein YphA (DoxX/SURF4 family)
VELVTAPYLVAAALLLLAGAAKLVSPASTASAMREAGLPGSQLLVRALGTVEVVVGAAALLVGGRPAAIALAAAYLGVSAVAWTQRRAGADCGCFGTSETPVSGVHLSVNAVAVLVSVAAVVTVPSDLPAALGAAPWWGLPTLAALAVAVLLVRTLLVVLPDVQAARALHPAEVDA